MTNRIGPDVSSKEQKSNFLWPFKKDLPLWPCEGETVSHAFSCISCCSTKHDSQLYLKSMNDGYG